MEDTKDLLDVRKKQLLKLKKEKEKSLLQAPEGMLRVSCRGEKILYFQRIDPKDTNGIYIKAKDVKLAEKLAQKDYDQKVLDSVNKEIKAIDKYFANYPDRCAEAVYDKLHDARKKLIMPIIETDEEYIKSWQQVEYKGKDFYGGIPEYYTAKGERVRSKSEVIIADSLHREGIPYRYEYPVYLNGVGVVYPDFTVLNIKKRQELLWEHFGKMDDPEYAEKAVRKIESYERNGIFSGENLILTYETMNQPLNQRTIKRMIERNLK